MLLLCLCAYVCVCVEPEDSLGSLDPGHWPLVFFFVCFVCSFLRQSFSLASKLQKAAWLPGLLIPALGL